MSSSDLSGCDAATSRSSPKRISQVVSTFGGFKRKLVSDIGFQGMLKVPDISNLDRKFTLSLLNQIDIKKRGIRVSEQTWIDISAGDVHRYLDIPMGPNKLFGLDDRSASEKMDFIRFGIGSSSFDIDEKNSLKAAEEIVRADYPDGMSESQAEQFKVSFVCFTMGNFLLAKYSSNHGIKDFWGSLMKPSEISSYNFCQAVVDEILECARHVQRETKANRTVKNLSGCHLYLQARYLDSINCGVLNLPASGIPRIGVFTSRHLQQMVNCIQSNYNSSEGETPNSGIKKQVFSSVSKLSSASKGKTSNQIMNSSVYMVPKPASTEYLASYTRGGVERKLNDKQIDDLRLHNARMKLFITSFKTKTYADIQAFFFSNPTIREMFNCNVEFLMNQVLDQVLVLSKSLHEHAETSTKASMISPSIYTTSKRASDNLISGYESNNDCSSIKRTKRFKLPTGKNLFPDLSRVAAKSASFLPSPEDAQAGQMLKSGSEAAFITPDCKLMKQKNIMICPDFTPIVHDKLKDSNSMAATGSESNPSSTYLNEEKFSTPIGLVNISAVCTDNRSYESDVSHLEEILEDPVDLDLNDIPSNHDLTYSPFTRILLSKGRMAKNPWFYGVPTKVVDKEVAETLFSWLGVTNHECLDSLWIKHSFPKEIKIAGNDFKSVFTRGYNFTNELLDLAIRRFGQMDRCMYGDSVNLRWLHPFESDFARKVINDEDFLSSRSIRLQLTGKSEEYNISNCRMIAVPNKTGLTWCSYFWDMKEHIVHVIDPTFNISDASEIHVLHNPIVDKLQGAIQTCFAAAYDGWDIDWTDWKKNYVMPFLPGKNSSESGMITLLALRQFNGKRFEIPQTEGSLSSFSKELFYDMLSLEGNRGVVPDVFIQCV